MCIIKLYLLGTILLINQITPLSNVRHDFPCPFCFADHGSVGRAGRSFFWGGGYSVEWQ